MKCPQCGVWTIVAATRDGIKRTRVCANEHRFHTQEMVVVLEKKPDTTARNAAIRADTRRPSVIAEAFGLSVRTVKTIRQKQ